MSKNNLELKFLNDMLRAENEALKDALRALVGRAVIDTRCLDDDIDAKETKLRLEEEARPLVVLKSCVENFLKHLDALASFDSKNASSVFVSSSERFELWKLVRNAREDLMKAMQ